MRIVGRLSDDCPADVWRRRRDLHGAVDSAWKPSGSAVFRKCRAFPSALANVCRCVLLRPQGVAKCGPAVVVAEVPDGDPVPPMKLFNPTGAGA